MNYKAIKYTNSLISQVICRIDFLDIMTNGDIFDVSVISEITKNFTRKEMDQVIRFNFVNVTDSNDRAESTLSNKTITGIQQTYTTPDGENKIILSNKFLVAEFNNYVSFEDLSEKIKSIITAIYRKNKITSERIGLRFVNMFDAEKMRVLKKWFIPQIANALSPIIDPHNNELIPIRSMHLAEYRSESLIINFRFGLYNKAYPNKITSDDFVLDFDCFTNEGYQSSRDILNCIETSHDRIQYLFENSITDALRKVMDNG